MSLQPYPGNVGWPADWQGSRFTGKFLSITGVPITGSITFTPTATAVISGVSKTIIIGATVSVPLTQGGFDVVLPASNDPDMNPTGWTYQVVENFPGGRKYHVSAPVDAVQDLSVVSPVPAANGVSIVRGKSAYEVAVDNGFVGTEAEWLDSLGGGGGGSVLSVNGKTGSVVLSASDVGAAPTGHTHTSANINDSTSVGRAVLTAADAAAARAAIGAGTSSLQLGTSSATAKAGDYKPPVADLPAGAVLYTSGTVRPTARTDVCVIFTGADPGTAALAGDIWAQAA